MIKHFKAPKVITLIILRTYDKSLVLLADTLAKWADEFEYDKMLGLIEQAKKFRNKV